VKRRIRYGGDPEGIAESGDRGLVTIGDAKRWHAIFVSHQNRVNRILQAAPETNRDQQIFRAQQEYLLLQIASRAYRCLCIQADRD